MTGKSVTPYSALLVLGVEEVALVVSILNFIPVCPYGFTQLPGQLKHLLKITINKRKYLQVFFVVVSL